MLEEIVDNEPHVERVSFNIKKWAKDFFDPMLVTMAVLDRMSNSASFNFNQNEDLTDHLLHVELVKFKTVLSDLQQGNQLFSIAKLRGEAIGLKASDDFYTLVSILSQSPGEVVMYVTASAHHSHYEGQHLTCDWLASTIRNARSGVMNLGLTFTEDQCPLLPRNHLELMWKDQKLGSSNKIDLAYPL